MTPAHRSHVFVCHVVLMAAAMITAPASIAARQATSAASQREQIYDRWSRGTTLIEAETRQFLENYSATLKKVLGVSADGDIAPAAAKVPADDLHTRVVRAYETAIETATSKQQVAPRDVNPLIRAQFGSLLVSTASGSNESLATALDRGRPLMDDVLRAAYQATVAGRDPLGDRAVLNRLELYIEHRQRITQTIANELRASTGRGWVDDIGINQLLAYVFGVVFVIVMLAIAALDRNPTPLGILIYRVVLALAAAGIGAVIPGMINVDIPIIRAGGAIALFVIVYRLRPAELVTGPVKPKHGEAFNITIPPGWSFKQTAEAAARIVGVVIDVGALKADELSTPMNEGVVTSSSFEELLTLLRFKAATPDAIRDYTVAKKTGVYRFNVKGSEEDDAKKLPVS
jgi:hypothetical protein